MPRHDFSLRRTAAVARKEFLHVLRDWRSLALALAIPALLILLFGYALKLDLNDVPTTVWDQSRTPESRDLIAQFDGSPYFSIAAYREGYRALQQDLDTGRALVVLVVPRDFADRLRANKPVAVQVIADGSDANTARLALGYADALGALYGRQVTAERLDRLGVGKAAPPVDMRQRALYNADLRSQNVLVPGIIVIVMVVISAMLTSVTVAREWELGTMEQLISTPLRPAEIVLGKVAPYMVIGFVDVLMAVAMGQWIYQVPLRGNVGLLFASAVLFLTGAMSFGMLLSITFKNQLQANQIGLLGSYMPNLLLSGFTFAIANMPKPVQIITYLVPGRYFLEVLRGIYLKGVGLEILWVQGIILVVYACLMVARSVKSMRLKLE